MHAFDVLGDPVRRRILELLLQGEKPAGSLVEAIQHDFPISQAAVSQHLKVLRETGFAQVRIAGTQRIYAISSAPLKEVDAWLDQFRRFWGDHLTALTKEIAKGKREQASPLRKR